MTSPAVGRVLTRLQAADCRPRGDVEKGWDALCPSHEDRDPSLKLDQGADGRALLCCHAGCETTRVLDELGLAWPDVYPEGSSPNGRGDIDALYDYVDEHGELLYQVVRWHPKRFTQRRPDGAGGWVWKLDKTRRVLFRLPKVTEAIAAGETIHVVEGEKDVLALERAGAVATCNSGGAGKWRAEHTETLRGADVVIVRDIDPPHPKTGKQPGQEHAEAVREALKGVAASVRVVEPVEGSDTSDHLAAGHGLDEFRLAEPGSEPQPGSPPRRTGDITGDTFALDAPTQIAPIWGAGTRVLWAAGEPTMIYGPDGVGKTTLVQQLTLTLIGIGDPWLLSHPVAPVAGKVLYLALDRPPQAARSMRRMVTEQDREILHERLTVWRGTAPFDLLRHPESLAAFAYERGASAVVIDSLKDIAMKLSDEDTGMAIHRAWQLCVEAGIEVLSLHHPRKAQADNKKPRALADVYGSRWLTSGCGSVLLLWGDAGDPVVELGHLKQPADVVGPLTLLHDSQRGTTTVVDDRDVVRIVAAQGGMATVAEVTAVLFPKSTERNDIEKVRRKLDGAVRDGALEKPDPAAGEAALYHLPGGVTEKGHGGSRGGVTEKGHAPPYVVGERDPRSRHASRGVTAQPGMGADDSGQSEPNVGPGSLAEVAVRKHLREPGDKR